MLVRIFASVALDVVFQTRPQLRQSCRAAQRGISAAPPDAEHYRAGAGRVCRILGIFSNLDGNGSVVGYGVHGQPRWQRRPCSGRHRRQDRSGRDCHRGAAAHRALEVASRRPHRAPAGRGASLGFCQPEPLLHGVPASRARHSGCWRSPDRTRCRSPRQWGRASERKICGVRVVGIPQTISLPASSRNQHNQVRRDSADHLTPVGDQCLLLDMVITGQSRNVRILQGFRYGSALARSPRTSTWSSTEPRP